MDQLVDKTRLKRSRNLPGDVAVFIVDRPVPLTKFLIMYNVLIIEMFVLIELT